MIKMKKINKKGFVLVETLVVSAFVLMIFVLVFRNGLPMMEEYKKIENYDDIDSLYYANLVRNVLKRDDEDMEDFYYDLMGQLSSTNSPDFIDLTNCNTWPDLNLCETIKLRIGITKNDKIFITHSDPSRIKGKVFVNDRRFNEYINYLNDRYDEGLEQDKYMILITRTIENKNPYMDSEEIEKLKDVKTVKYGSIGI